MIDRCCEYYKSGTDYEGLSRVKEYADANLKGHGKISVLKKSAIIILLVSLVFLILITMKQHGMF